MMEQQKRILVIGAGYAGMLATIRLAGKTRHQNVAITLVNASDVFVERVRLHEMAANRPVKQKRIQDVLKGTGVDFVQGLVTGIDAGRREISVRSGGEARRIDYDYLLYALGSTIDRESVPGVKEYAYTLTPSGELSAIALKEKLAALNQRGGRLIVCGGGATGVEAAAEFAAGYPTLRVQLVTRGEFGAFLGKTVAAYMRKSLERLGVTIMDHTIVGEVRADSVLTTDGKTIPGDVCLWAGGFAVPTLAREAGLGVNDRGQILIDPFTRSISHPEIYTVGDAAYPVEEPGTHVRMSAFTALVIGAHGADCLSAAIRGKTPKPLSFAYVGQGIALGPRNAIGFNNYPNDKPHAPYFTGRLGFEIRAFFVRFLSATPGLERRWPGFFYWIGKGRYEAAKRRMQSRAKTGARQSA